MFSKPILLFAICIISIFCISSLNAQNFSPKYRDLYFETHNGLPRFGEQNTFGLVIPGERHNKSQLRAHKNKELAKNLSSQIEKHNYSISLLKRLGFINKYADCFKNMNKYEANTEVCAGFVIGHENQGRFWKKYIELMTYALKPQYHAATFCNNISPCGIRSIDSIRVKNQKGQTLKLDEFERRDFVSDLMKNEYQAFEQLIKTKNFHKEGYFVSKVQIGEYDFDKNQFHVRLRIPRNFMSQNVFWLNTSNSISSKLMPAQSIYKPTLPFEDSMKEKSGSLQFNINLPMSANQARSLIKNNRTLFAVTRMAYVPQGAIALENPVGTAPCFIVEYKSPLSKGDGLGMGAIISLPGVPREMETTFQEAVVPYLQNRYTLDEIIKVRLLHTAGIGEGRLDEKIGDLEELSNPTVGLAAHIGVVDIRLAAKAKTEVEANTMLAKVENEIRQRLGNVVFGTDQDTLEGVTLAAVAERGWKFVSLESGLEGRLSRQLEKAASSALIQTENKTLAPDEMLPALQKLKAESGADVALGVSFFASETEQTAEVSLLTPDAEKTRTLCYGGHPSNALRWASNIAINILRRAAE